MYKEEINKEISSALKNGDKIKLSVWRLIKTEFVKFETSGKNVELTDDKELQIINKMVQQKKDSIEDYKNGNRNDLVEIAEQELNVLIQLLPKEPTETDIEECIKEYVRQKESVSMKDMKDVMTFVKKQFPTANGAIVSNIFKVKFIL